MFKRILKHLKQRLKKGRITLVPRTKLWRFYAYLWLDKKFLSIGFYYKGNEVLFHLYPWFWIKEKAFYSVSFIAYFPTLKALDKEREEYARICRRNSN